MKKYIYSTILALGLVFSVGVAQAATSVTLSPTNKTVSAGQTFTVSATFNPNGTKLFTGRLALSYPADVLEVTNFTAPSTFFSLAQPGYDLVDNTNGKLLKTAGFPGGMTDSSLFGTVTFKAKKSGNATIALNSDVLALDSGNNNDFNNVFSTVAVTVPAPVVQETVVEPVVTESEPVVEQKTEVVVNELPEIEETNEISETEVATTTVAENENTDLLAQASETGSTSSYLWLVIVLVVIAGGYVLYSNKREQ